MIQAENITNAMAKILLNDVDIQNYCQDKFSKPLVGEDNLVFVDSLVVAEKPSFTVTKLPTEKHYFNRGADEGTESTWSIMVSFFGDFGEGQLDNDTFTLPSGAKQTINGVDTYTPSDTMRILARKAGVLAYKKMECEVPGILVESIEVDAEDYYDTTSGEVKSFVKIDLYRKSTLY